VRARWAFVAVAVAAGALAWALWPGGSIAPDAPSPDAVPASETPEAAALEGRVSRPAAAPTASRARGSIEGTVRRRGKAVPARVSAWLTAPLEEGVPASWRADLRATGLVARLAADVPPVATATAGEDGRFVLPGIGAGVFEVVAVAGDGGRGFAEASRTLPDAASVVNVEVHGGPERLAGRAVYADGSPFAGRVGAAPAWADEPPEHALALVATDAEGRFVLEGLEAGGNVVVAVAEGFFSQSTSVAVPHAGDFTFVVDDGLAPLEGRVVADADGSPVAGATVDARAWSTAKRWEARARAVTGADGSFRVTAAAAQQGRLYVRAAGFAPAERETPAARTGFVVRLARAARVTGRVTALATGAPAEGVDVYVWPGAARGSERAWAEGGHGVTDVEGLYGIDGLVPGERTVLAMGRGWITPAASHAVPSGWDPLAVDVPAGGSVVVDLVVVPAGRVAGRVLEPGGAPARAARVTWETSESAPAEYQTGKGVLVLHRDVVAGADGAFVVDTIPPGQSVDLEAGAAGFSPGRVEGVVATAEGPAPVEIRLVPARWIDVRVEEDETHAPIASASVSAEGNKTVGHVTWSTNLATAVTGPDGAARLGPLPDAEIELSVWHETRGHAWIPDLEKATKEGGVYVVRMRKSLSISGRVSWSDGSPAAGGVSVSSPSWSSSGSLDGEGRFRLGGMPAGTYSVSVHPRGGAAVVREAKAGEEGLDVLVSGRPLPDLTVLVVDPEGKPVPSASLRWSGEGRGDVAVSDGRATVPASAGDVWLEVARATTASVTRAPLGAALAGPVASGAPETTVRLPPERRIEGVVVGPDERGVAGVRVTAEPVRTDAASNLYGSHDAARTGPDGRFRLGGLWDGEYQLQVAVPPDLLPPAKPVTVRSGASDARVVLRGGAAFTPPVLDWRGRPVPGAEVILSPLDDHGADDPEPVKADEQGVARLVGLDPEVAVTLEVTPPKGWPEALPLRVAEWKPSSEPLRLPRALALRGIVRDAAGRPSAGATVQAKSLAGHGWSQATSDAAGAFVLEDVAEGELEVTAFGPKTAPSRSRPLRVRSDAGDVVLVLRPSATLVVRLEGHPTGAAPRIRLDAVDEKESSSTASASIDADWSARLEGLDAEATYVVSIHDWGVGLLARRAGVGGGAGEVRVPLVPARTIEGRAVLPAGSAHARAWISEAGLWSNADVAGDGRFRLTGLPEGTWLVHVDATGPGGAALHGEAKAEAGGTVEIAVAAAKGP
jgi:hypothetical protein